VADGHRFLARGFSLLHLFSDVQMLRLASINMWQRPVFNFTLRGRTLTPRGEAGPQG
jgi:hypothetical protein